jgi:hypothetical protein
MTLESINYIALFAGAFLLMSRSGHRLYLWSRFETRARSKSEKNRGSPASSRCESAVAPVSDTAGGEAAQAADASPKASAGICAATLTPYGCGGHYFFGGHYG